jgi:hypothetical protein
VPTCTLTQCPPGRVSLSQNVQQFCLLSVHLALARCPPGRALRILNDSVSSSELSTEFFLKCTLAHMLNAHLAELHRILSDSGSLLNSQQSSSNCTLCLCSMPTWQSLQNPHRILSATVSLIHSLASKVFNNLEVFPELLIPVLVPQARLCLNPQCSEVHPLCTAIRTRSVLSHPPGVKPQRPSPEIKHTPANAQLQYTSTTYKEHSQTFT